MEARPAPPGRRERAREQRQQPHVTPARLLAIAEEITKLLAICVRCGNPAVHTQRLVESEELVVVGASGIYEARCRRCFEPNIALAQEKKDGPQLMFRARNVSSATSRFSRTSVRVISIPSVAPPPDQRWRRDARLPEMMPQGGVDRPPHVG